MLRIRVGRDKLLIAIFEISHAWHSKQTLVFFYRAEISHASHSKQSNPRI